MDDLQPKAGDIVRVVRRRDKTVMCNFGTCVWTAMQCDFDSFRQYWVFQGDGKMHVYNSRDHEVTI